MTLESDDGPFGAERLLARREALAQLWGLSTECVVIAAGHPVLLPGSDDITYPFRAHPDYYYLTGRDSRASLLAYDPLDGWTDFDAPPALSERLWQGVEASTRPPLDVATWFAQRSGRRFGLLGSGPAVAPYDLDLSESLRATLQRMRTVKDDDELRRIRRAIACTAEGFAALYRHLSEGVTERALQIEIEAATYRGGATALAFPTVVASGRRTCFAHAVTSQRRLAAGDHLIVDLGAEYHRYAADVTRTVFVGEATAISCDLRNIVQDAQRAAIRQLAAGRSIFEMFHQVSVVLASGLVGIGLLKSSVDAVIESDLLHLFLLHSPGHHIGLGVHDGTDYLVHNRSGLSRGSPAALQPGSVVTVEPGVYFVPEILDRYRSLGPFRDLVDWKCLDELSPLGGVRVEDVVLVTRGEAEVLSADIP